LAKNSGDIGSWTIKGNLVVGDREGFTEGGGKKTRRLRHETKSYPSLGLLGGRLYRGGRKGKGEKKVQDNQMKLSKQAEATWAEQEQCSFSGGACKEAILGGTHRGGGARQISTSLRGRQRRSGWRTI